MIEILIIPTKDANLQAVKQIKLTLEFQGKKVEVEETGELESIVRVFVDNTDKVRIESGDEVLQSTIPDAPKNIYDVLKATKSKQIL